MIDLSEGGVRTEFWRQGNELVFRSLNAAGFAFRTVLKGGCTLTEATELALVEDPAFNLAQSFVELFQQGIVVGFRMGQEENTP